MTTITERGTDWRAAGACLHADPDLFFPISSAGRALGQIAQAKAICAGCPVRRQCWEFAQENALEYGVWGGATPEERQRARRRGQHAQTQHGPSRRGQYRRAMS